MPIYRRPLHEAEQPAVDRRQSERDQAHSSEIARSDDLVYIQITVFNTRTAEQKKALFRRVAELLRESPGVRPEDVFVNVLEAAKENWSLGHGLAQFA